MEEKKLAPIYFSLYGSSVCGLDFVNQISSFYFNYYLFACNILLLILAFTFNLTIRHTYGFKHSPHLE